MQLEPPQRIFQPDNRVIDQLADGNRQPAQGHGVDRQAEPLKHQRGDQKRQRNRGERNQRHAPVAEHRKQHYGHHHSGLRQLSLEVIDRAFNETGLPEGDLRRSQTGRHGLAQFGQRRLDLPRQLHGVGTGLFLYAENHRRLAVEAGITALDCGCKRHRGNLLEQDRLGDGAALMRGHRHRGQIVKRSRTCKRADQILAAIDFQKAAAGVVGKIAQRRFHLLQCHAQFGHPRRVRLHLELAYLAANRDHLRDARYVEQARAQHPVGVFAHLHRRRALRIDRQRDLHDLAHDRGHRSHGGRDAGR